MNDLIKIDEVWLRDFFSEKNLISNDNEWYDFISLWKEFYLRKDAPICFAYKENEKNISFYFGSQSLIGTNILKQELVSFLGYYYSNYNGLYYNLNPDIYHENLLSKVFRNPCFKIEISSLDKITKIKDRIIMYGKLIKSKPEIIRKVKLPFGQIRDLFDKAILSGDYKNAYKYKEDLISNGNDGRLTPQHELYLNIRLIAGLGYWEKFNINDLRKLMDFRKQLPVSIVRDITAYFYNVGVLQFEKTDDFKGCLKQLDHYKFKEFTGFFNQKKMITDQKSLTIFLIAEIIQDNFDLEYALSIFKKLEKHETIPLVKKIHENFLLKSAKDQNKQKIMEKTDHDEFFEKGKLYFFDDEFDKALFCFLRLSPSASVLVHIFKCLSNQFYMTPIKEWPLHEGYSEKVIVKVEEFFNSLPKVEKDIFFENKKNIELINSLYLFKKNDQDTKKEFENEWIKWLKKVEIENNNTSLIDNFNNYANDWSVINFVDNSQNLDSFFERLINLDTNLFNKIYKKLYEIFIFNEDFKDKNFVNFFISFLERLSLSDNFNINDLQLCFSLQELILTIGVSKDQYLRLIDALIMQINLDTIGLNNFNIMLDIAELIAYFPKSDESSAVKFHSIIQEIGLKNLKRLDDSQKYCLKKIHFDYSNEMPDWLNLEDKTLVEKDFFENSLSHLVNKKVAIYTLNENAGRRIKNIINDKVPSCNVNVNSDKECTRRLKSLSTNSDIFVFAWKSSKHQAFYCIKENRSSDLPFLLPLGKGSASILNELINLN